MTEGPSADAEPVACTGCGATLDEASGLPFEQRTPCPQCGSRNRTVGVQLADGVGVHASITGKGRHGERGKARPFVQVKAGADLFRKTGKWNEREKVEDRDRDQYHERIIDPETGVVLHECNEPLSSHRGHGSAKRRNDSGG